MILIMMDVSPFYIFLYHHHIFHIMFDNNDSDCAKMCVCVASFSYDPDDDGDLINSCFMQYPIHDLVIARSRDGHLFHLFM